VTIGTYTPQYGLGLIRADLANNLATDAMPVLTISNLIRPTGSIVNLSGGPVASLGRTTAYNLGQGSGAGFVQLQATQINGAAPSTELINGIIPWALCADSPANAGRLATYGGNGFKPYGFDATGALNDNGGTEPFATTIAAANSTTNVYLTADEAVAGNVTLNSLSFEGSHTISGAGTLQLTSGALVSYTYGTVNTKIDFQGREGIIYAVNNLILGGSLQNDGGHGVSFSTASPNFASYIIRINAAGTWTGPTRILHGALEINGANLLPNTALRIDAIGALGIRGSNSVASLSGTGFIGTKNGGANPILTVGSDNSSTTFSGIIGKDGTVFSGALDGQLGLTKVGSGNLTLSGNNNYSLATTVSNGTLVIDGNILSDLTVSSGANIAGTGTLKNVTVMSGGRITGGNTISAGNMTLSANLLLNSGSVLLCNLMSATQYDQIVAQGNVNLNADSGAGATLQVVLDYAPRVGQQFTIIDKQSAGAISGAFANGTRVSASFGGRSYSFSISTTGGSDSNDVVLMALPRGTMFRIE
jgi:autotransporter-associated beta strand protein